ncbi:MAG: Hpt domain-containing protein [Acidobacteria bacterium]|nr:Hpt domain-containing protein [Acidobacteriota bacterium]
MDTEALRQRLMGTFARELDEHVATLNSCLIELEKSSEGAERDELVRTLFRSAHSIKGAARMVGLEKVEKTAHNLEESLAHLRDKEVPLSPDLIRSLFLSVDSMERAGAELAASRPGAEGGDEAAGLPPHARLEAGPASSSRVAPIDRLEPMIRVDAQKLEDLVRANGETMVARRRMTRRIEELEGLQERVDAWTSQWLRGETALRQHLKGNGAKATADRSAAAAAELVEQNRIFLRRLGAELERITESITSNHRQMERAALPLQDQIHQMRMQPLRLAAEPLQRAVRDVAGEAGKEVDLTIRGGDIELDRSILEALGSPLLHLVRNAIDHGIESPEERRKKGKPDAGRVVIEASLEGSGVTIEISDDGRGIDLAVLRRKAEERNLALSDDEDLTELIFHPGLSTAPSVTAVSGRGIGLDVVRSRVESLHGTIGVNTESGKGTRFRMTLPLTLTTIRALLVRAGGETLAIPSIGIEAIQRVGRSEIRSMEGRDVLTASSGPVPLVPLAHLLGLPAPTEVSDLLQVVRVRVEPDRTPDGPQRFVQVHAADDRPVACANLTGDEGS